MLSECGIGLLFYSTVYAYNSERTGGAAPQTIDDFFDLERFPGRRGICPTRRIALCVGLAFLAGVGCYAYWARLEHSFTIITAYQLDQSAQLPPEKLLEIADEHGVRTVVDLRSLKDGTAIETERRALVDTRIAYVHLPAEPETDDETIRRLLEIVGNPANRPVLVHCHDGTDRSVLLASIFRLGIDILNSGTAGRTVEPLHWCGHFPPDQPEGRYLLSYVRNRPKVTLVSRQEQN